MLLRGDTVGGRRYSGRFPLPRPPRAAAGAGGVGYRLRGRLRGAVSGVFQGGPLDNLVFLAGRGHRSDYRKRSSSNVSVLRTPRALIMDAIFAGLAGGPTVYLLYDQQDFSFQGIIICNMLES